MRDTEHLYQKIMEELDLSREIEDEALMELIYTVLSEERREHYMSLQEMNMLGKELFNAFRKLDILQDLIEDEEITEIMINGALTYLYGKSRSCDKTGEAVCIETKVGRCCAADCCRIQSNCE